MSNLNLLSVPTSRDVAMGLGIFGSMSVLGVVGLMGVREIVKGGNRLLERAAAHGNTWTAVAIKTCGYATKLFALLVAIPMLLLTTVTMSVAAASYFLILSNNPVITTIITVVTVLALDALSAA